MAFWKEYMLTSVLEEEIGIKNLLGNSSNLSEFANNIVVSFDDIVHKAVLNVDEEGSNISSAFFLIATKYLH